MTDILIASLRDRQEKFCRHAIYGMIDGSRNTIFSWWKTPNGRVKLENGGNSTFCARALTVTAILSGFEAIDPIKISVSLEICIAEPFSFRVASNTNWGFT